MRTEYLENSFSISPETFDEDPGKANKLTNFVRRRVRAVSNTASSHPTEQAPVHSPNDYAPNEKNCAYT